MCNNKLYKKFFIFSSVFFILSIVVNSLIVYAATSPEPKKPKSKITKKIRHQQRAIIDRLNKIEEKNRLIKINGR
jgi:hypothetical protein